MALNVFIGLVLFALFLCACALMLIAVLNNLFDRKLVLNHRTFVSSLAIVVFLATVVYRL
jgi:hypothetical protein